MTTTTNAAQVTITLAKTAAGKVQVTVTRDGEVIATRATKDGDRFVQRIDAFIRSVSVRRQGYHVEGDVMVATGVQFF